MSLLAETLLDIDSTAGSDNSSTKTETDDSDQDSDSLSNDEECADLARPTQMARSTHKVTIKRPTQMARSSQKMAIERPFWPASATDNTTDKDHGNVEDSGTANDTPGPLSLALDHWTSRSYSQADTYTCSDAETAGAPLLRIIARRIPIPRAIKEWDSQVPFLRAIKWHVPVPRTIKELTRDPQLIRDVITASFPFLRASIVTHHAFPDAILTSTFVLRALVAATSHNPNATCIQLRIVNDHMYLAKMITLPQARISIFRAEVKERCVAAVALLVNTHSSPTLIADLINRQINDNYNYIHPRRLNSNILSRIALRNRPYRSTIITSVIRDLFFTGPVPFVIQHQDLLPSYQGADGTVTYEVPKAMVALVSTAYYAALKEWITGERKQCDFTANMNLDVYKGHVNTLDAIESTHKPSYHRMMAEIYQLAASNIGQTTLPVPTLDMSMLEFED
ncbi:hypothetical protein BJY52DRAFT_1189338 [Lactarius psammicola]|nr:hypothetical protein BJY52DRAFT_1189338 [Lactarius psammicola]